MVPTRKFGDKKINLLGVKLGEIGPQKLFLTALAKLAASFEIMLFLSNTSEKIFMAPRF